MSTAQTTPEKLPHIDEHSIEVDRGARDVWDAVLAVVDRTMAGSSVTARFAQLIGSADKAAGGPRPLDVGSTMPGFHVVTAERERELWLEGSHRFSRYALVFRFDELEETRTRIRAETRATFPGVLGRIYKGFVIDTRAHVVVVRRVLGVAKRRAERRAR
jgi:hypothetical protein